MTWECISQCDFYYSGEFLNGQDMYQYTENNDRKFKFWLHAKTPGNIIAATPQ